MIFSIFLYQKATGFAIWQKSFNSIMDQQQLQLYSSFFSAIQTFIKSLAKNPNTTLNMVDLGNLIVYITPIPEIQIDLVTITEKQDLKTIPAFHSKIIGALKNNQKMFPDWNAWDGNVGIFKALDYEIFSVLRGFKGLMKDKMDLTSSDNPMISWQIEEMHDEQIQIYQEEIQNLRNQFKSVNNPIQKKEILDSITYWAIKLKDQDIVYQTEKQKLEINKEIDSIKYKITYFIGQAKNIVSNIDPNLYNDPKLLHNKEFREYLRQIFLNLYSASSKIRLLGDLEKAEELRDLSSIFVERPEGFSKEIFQYLQKVHKLPEQTPEIV